MEQIRQKRWSIREPDPAMVTSLCRALAVSPIMAGLLVNRAISDPETASRFLSTTLADLHDPFLLRGMEPAVERLLRAIQNGERICIYGDYDVDGVTAVALLISFFRSIDVDCFYHIPKRLEDGYGLSAEGVAAAVARGARVIITVDCGVTAVEEAMLCKELRVDLIITDHHTPGDRIPDAVALIDPHQAGCQFPFKFLAGVGVAFNLLIALRGRLRNTGWFDRKKEPDLRDFLDLVALGTIADLVPLLDENRIFAKYGLTVLSGSSRQGVRALKRVAGVSGPVGCGVVGFRLAPRLNAAGRLENAALGVELLLCDDPQQAAAMAAELDASNAERQALEQEILRDALAMVGSAQETKGRKSIVLASKAWHPGVIGIVASRIVDIYHRPTVLIALQDGNGRGSGRSIPGFHLHDALRACSDHLVKVGGHKYAAGLSVDEVTLEDFVASFEEVAAGRLTPGDLTPELAIDAELIPGELTVSLAETIQGLAPFGIGNPEPVFLIRSAEVLERRVIKEQHLKLQLRAGGARFEAIGFNLAAKQPAERRVDVAFSLDMDDWRGQTRLQLKLKDVRNVETDCGE